MRGTALRRRDLDDVGRVQHRPHCVVDDEPRFDAAIAVRLQLRSLLIEAGPNPLRQLAHVRDRARVPNVAAAETQLRYPHANTRDLQCEHRAASNKRGFILPDRGYQLVPECYGVQTVRDADRQGNVEQSMDPTGSPNADLLEPFVDIVVLLSRVFRPPYGRYLHCELAVGLPIAKNIVDSLLLPLTRVGLLTDRVGGSPSCVEPAHETLENFSLPWRPSAHLFHSLDLGGSGPPSRADG